MEFIRYVDESESDPQGFKLWPTKVHGYITLPLSILGIIFNMLTIIIFSQKSMRSATNNILLGISAFDILLMAVYIPYIIYFYLFGTPDPKPGQSAFWPYFAVYIYSNLCLFAHGCSVWYTCFLALYRYITVKSCISRGGGNPLFTETRVRYIMIIIVFVMLSFMSFNTLIYGVQKTCVPFIRVDNLNINLIDSNSTLYEICTTEEILQVTKMSDPVESSNDTETMNDALTAITEYLESSTISGNMSKPEIFWLRVLWIQNSILAEKYPSMIKINFWIHGIVFRTLPCLILLVLSILLIHITRIAHRNRLSLMKRGKRKEYDKAGEFNRTTIMLLIVVISFLIMELPHGILFIICSISKKFFNEVYVNLGDLLDLLVLINGTINFFLYCCMSSQFRNKFKDTFCLLCIKKPDLVSKRRKSMTPSIVNLRRFSRSDSMSRSLRAKKAENGRTNGYFYKLLNQQTNKEIDTLCENEVQNEKKLRNGVGSYTNGNVAKHITTICEDDEMIKDEFDNQSSNERVAKISFKLNE